MIKEITTALLSFTLNHLIKTWAKPLILAKTWITYSLFPLWGYKHRRGALWIYIGAICSLSVFFTYIKPSNVPQNPSNNVLHPSCFLGECKLRTHTHTTHYFWMSSGRQEQLWKTPHSGAPSATPTLLLLERLLQFPYSSKLRPLLTLQCTTLWYRG